MKTRLNPLFPNNDKQPVIATTQMEPVEAGALSPVTNKPMRKVMCDKIPAYYDPDSRLILPMKA